MYLVLLPYCYDIAYLLLPDLYICNIAYLLRPEREAFVFPKPADAHSPSSSRATRHVRTAFGKKRPQPSDPLLCTEAPLRRRANVYKCPPPPKCRLSLLPGSAVLSSRAVITVSLCSINHGRHASYRSFAHSQTRFCLLFLRCESDRWSPANSGSTRGCNIPCYRSPLIVFPHLLFCCTRLGSSPMLALKLRRLATSSQCASLRPNA